MTAATATPPSAVAVPAERPPALVRTPRSTYVHDLLASINDALSRGDWDATRAVVLAATHAAPYDPGVLTALGAAHELSEQYDEALLCCVLAVCETPTNAAAWQNFAMISGRGAGLKNPHLQALLASRMAAEANPRAVLPAYGTAVAYRALGYAEKGGQWVREVAHRLERYGHDPANAGVVNTFNAAFMHLELGSLDPDQYVHGFRAYEARLNASSHQLHERARTRPVDAGPRWTHGPPPKRLAIFYEQGAGDAIMCVRYVQLLAKQGVEIVLEAHSQLEQLFRERLDTSGVTVIGPDAPLPHPVDGHVWIMSLPGMFWDGPEKIPPGGLTYHPEPAQYVAFSWQGSRAHRSDKIRSTSPDTFRAAAELVRAKGLTPIAVNHGEPTPDFLAPPPIEIRSMADTARILDACAAAVSVDSALVHLAGAMGVPALVCCAAKPDWRWGMGDPAPAWYTSVRVIRQPVIDDWASVGRQVVAALDQLLPATPTTIP